MIRFASQAVVITAIICASSNFDRAADVTSTFSGTGPGNWTAVAWSNNPAMGGYPDNGNQGVATYDAIVNTNYTITLDQNIEIQKLSLTNGTIAGSFNLTTDGLLHATAADFSGSGTTNANAGFQVDGYQSSIDGRTFNVAGSSSFTGDSNFAVGYFYISNGAIVNNSGTFDTGWSGNFSNAIIANGTAGTFNNTGTFTRSVGSGTTTVSVPFNNSNIVSVQAGTLLLNGGGTESGSFQVGSGAALGLGSLSMTLANGTSFSGTGAITISGTASLTGTTTTTAESTLVVRGALNGTGTLTTAGLLHIAEGALSGSGLINSNGSLQIDDYQNSLDGRTLNVNGPARFTGSATFNTGYFYVSNGAAVDNSSTFDAGWAANFNNNIVANGTVGTFNNTGMFTRSVGSGTTTVSIPFNSSNIVSVQAGKLVLNGGGTESSSFQVASGASLVLGSVSMTLNDGTSISGGGTTMISGTVSLMGTTTTDTTSTLVITGAINGMGTLTTAGPLHISAGSLNGSGPVNANGSLQIDDYQSSVDGRTLNVNGSATFTGNPSFGSGFFYVSDGAIVNNFGTFDAGWPINANNSILPNAAPGTFNNMGTFTRSVGTGTTTVSIPFNNSNMVTVQAGTLVLSGGNSMETGPFQVASGATLNISSTGFTLAAGSSLAGPGTTIISGTTTVTGPAVTYSGGGTLQLTGTLNGAGTLTASAPIEWTGGTMSGGGVTNANGGLSIDGYQNALDGRTLNVGGMAAFTGYAGFSVGYFYMSNGANVNSAGTFDVGWSTGFNNSIVSNGMPGTFTNTGTFTRSVGNGTTTVQVPFANNGVVNVGAGTLEFDGNTSLGNNSSLSVSAGKLKFVNTGTASVGSGVTATISGTGVLELAGLVSALGMASPAADRVAITNLSTAAAGVLISSGTQQVGAISGTGNVQVNAGTSLTADSIIAGALNIGGQNGFRGKVTIAPSDANGLPLDGGVTRFAAAGFASSSSAGEFLGSGDIGVYVGPPLDAGPEPVAGPAVDGPPVPEPSAIVILAMALLGVPPLVGRRRSR